MPNRLQQKRERRRERRKQVMRGYKAQKARFRRVRDEVAALGPEVATAREYFRKHDLSPEQVRARLDGPAPWAFTEFEPDGAPDALLLTQEARDMILALMEAQG